MKLLLTSNGLSSPELEKAFSELTNNRKDLKVAIIPTASDPIEWIPEKEGSKKYIAIIVEEKLEENHKWIEEYAKKYTDKGNEVVIVDLKTNPKEIKEKLHNVDLIDVTGGDVNYLIDWAKIAKLDTYLKDLLDKGVIYLGTSAGCGLVLPDVGMAWWEPDMDIDRIGLGIVDFTMEVHQKENDERKNTENLIKRKKYMQSIINFPWKVYLVQDGQAIKVDGDKIEHIGEGIKKSI